MSTNLPAALLIAVAALPIVAKPLAACDTPVYRYATYNWSPSPYRIYYIARGETLPEDHPVRRTIAELSTSPIDAPRPVANIELIQIDAAAEDPVEALPPDARGEAAFILQRATTGDEPPTLPRFAVVLPHGYPVYEGPLTEADVRAIADSPARAKIVDMIAGGKAAMMLLLEGDKPADNAAAEELIAATIARAAAGELSPPPDPSLSTSPADAKPARVDIGVLRIRRDDPAEKWLVMSLLHVEPDIADRTDPMVFSVYARGRVNPPAIGLGIRSEELDRQVQFVLGPCACTVKHDNPGVDLALIADWDAIALAMATHFGSETGNERLLGDVPGLFPEIIDIAAPTDVDRQTPAEPPAANVDSPANDHVAAQTERNVEQPQSPASVDADAPPGFTTGMSLEEATRKEPTLMRNVGIGVLVVMLLLGIASISLFRRPA